MAKKKEAFLRTVRAAVRDTIRQELALTPYRVTQQVSWAADLAHRSNFAPPLNDAFGNEFRLNRTVKGDAGYNAKELTALETIEAESNKSRKATNGEEYTTPEALARAAREVFDNRQIPPHLPDQPADNDLTYTTGKLLQIRAETEQAHKRLMDEVATVLARIEAIRGAGVPPVSEEFYKGELVEITKPWTVPHLGTVHPGTRGHIIEGPAQGMYYVKLLQKDPQDRWQIAAEALAHLEYIPPSPGNRARYRAVAATRDTKLISAVVLGPSSPEAATIPPADEASQAAVEKLRTSESEFFQAGDWIEISEDCGFDHFSLKEGERFRIQATVQWRTSAHYTLENSGQIVQLVPHELLRKPTLRKGDWVELREDYVFAQHLTAGQHGEVDAIKVFLGVHTAEVKFLGEKQLAQVPTDLLQLSTEPGK